MSAEVILEEDAGLVGVEGVIEIEAIDRQRGGG